MYQTTCWKASKYMKNIDYHILNASYGHHQGGKIAPQVIFDWTDPLSSTITVKVHSGAEAVSHNYTENN